MRSIGTLELLIVVCVVGIFLVPFWRIAKKAGYPGWIALLGCIPVLNILALWQFRGELYPQEPALAIESPRDEEHQQRVAQRVQE